MFPEFKHTELLKASPGGEWGVRGVLNRNEGAALPGYNTESLAVDNSG